MEGGVGIWEQLKERFWEEPVVKGKRKGRRQMMGGVWKHDKWMLESQIQDEGGQERGWADGLVSPIDSPGPR